MTETRRDAPSAHPDVEALLAAWREAIAAGAVGRMALLVTPDAEFWSPGQAPVRGREALKAAFEPFFERYEMNQEFDCHELIVNEPWAFMRGIEANRLADRTTGDVTLVQQRAFSVIRRGADGAWRFHRGMTNQPPGEAGDGQ